MMSVTRRLAMTLGLSASLGVYGTGPLARTVTDDLGREVEVREPPLRIVSLAPGATEMLFAAGAGGQLIATVEYSDEPPAARRAPRIGDVATVDMERLVALRPEVVIAWPAGGNPAQRARIDRKSTRLNSSHGYISYAVFCLKKKNDATAPSFNSGPHLLAHRIRIALTSNDFRTPG